MDPTDPITSLNPTSRREFLSRNAMGIGGVALASLLAQEKLLATPASKPVAAQSFDTHARPALNQPRAKAMISLFMHGGPSHMDLTDPKPELNKRSGEPYSGDVRFSFINRASKALMGSKWKFKPHGQCGTEFSELLPHIAGIADEISLVRSMHTGHNGHEVSIRYWHNGIPSALGRPNLGAWLSYALGSETDNLPAYMVLKDPGGNPTDSVHNWTNGWMPPLYRGTVLRAKEPRIHNLTPPEYLRGELQRQNLDFLRSLNERHLAANPGERDLEARIESYELAARMQIAATEALDISGESAATLKLYGIDEKVTEEYGKRCLIARRLVERGVRFVQLFLAGQPWDNHNTIGKYLPAVCARTDKPAAALVRDLKARGLLDTTIVHWGGEIGRLPVTENHGSAEKAGRDHNGQGFSCWMAGGGFKGGLAYGETDEFGHKAVSNIVTPNDYQATVLNQFGLDHSHLTFQYNGQEKSLTNNRKCRVVSELLNS
jgi:hypothetical protein